MIFDVNLSWGSWPFQESRFDSVRSFKGFLRTNGISGGFVRSSEAVFAPDLEHCNKKLFMDFRSGDGFIPAPTVNPSFLEWKDLLHPGKAISALVACPGYHGYNVMDEGFSELAGALENTNIILLLVIRQEDERQHYKYCRIPPVPVAEINKLGRKFPHLNIICLNSYFGELKILLTGAPNIRADIAFVETLNTLDTTLREIDHKQIVFGSHTPFLYTESALMKLKDSSINKKIYQSITAGIKKGMSQ